MDEKTVELIQTEELLRYAEEKDLKSMIPRLKRDIAKLKTFYGYELNEERLMCSQKGALDKLRAHNWQEERVYVFIFNNSLA